MRPTNGAPALPMIETRAGATEPCTIAALAPGGAPSRPQRAALTRQQRRLVERVQAHDAAWFAKHPGALRRVRPIVRGEFAPLVEDRAWTHVQVICSGGYRVRLPHAAPQTNGGQA